MYKPKERLALVLIDCQDSIESGSLQEYYAEVGGETLRVSEAELAIDFLRQDPNPVDQALHYEFHSPKWTIRRGAVIESYVGLSNATYGIDDLVSSRIMLFAHQAEVVSTVLSAVDCRYILADEVGLGKTVEAAVILKGLRRRYPRLSVLIVAPASLVHQWQHELDDKFWLDLPIVDRHLKLRRRHPKSDGSDSVGLIVSMENLAASDTLWTQLRTLSWDLVIVDEGHQLRKMSSLYDRVRVLSGDSKRSLILSATPIQGRADEYLDLLRLMDPSRYDATTVEEFARTVSLQSNIRRTVAHLIDDLGEDFDPEEFLDDLEDVSDDLSHDAVFNDLVARLKIAVPDLPLARSVAEAALAHLSENYRIESRLIRNRRAHLKIALPERLLDRSFSYIPGDREVQALESLYDYLQSHLSNSQDPITLEFCRVILNAAFSSPHAVHGLLRTRADRLADAGDLADPPGIDVTSSAGPRHEKMRVQALMRSVDVMPGESPQLESLQWFVERWRETTDDALRASRQDAHIDSEAPHRLVQALRSLRQALAPEQGTKVLVFSTWLDTLDALKPHLGGVHDWEQYAVGEFHVGLTEETLQLQADKFQENAHCRVLLCDELGGEGRNFQIADQILHLDLPWTPSQLEQRLGRVDRIGRSGSVLSIVPFCRESPEHDLFRLWQDAFSLFTRSISGMEIALEGVQDQLVAALASGVRDGLRALLSPMIEVAREIREQVEEEQYFERASVNVRRREEFGAISERYRDGKVLREAVLGWAGMAGLHPKYYARDDLVTFDPREFGEVAINNARFRPPNMEEALRRSRRLYDLRVKGTFNRDVAVLREDLVFFAPGNDPWTDALLKSALESDKGRSCAILYKADADVALNEPWSGFELLFAVQVDPRPLFSKGFRASHLFRAQGFLQIPTFRILISVDGEVISRGDPIWEVVRDSRISVMRTDHRQNFIHLGQRSGNTPWLDQFRSQYPPDMWSPLVHDVVNRAEEALDEEFSFTREIAEEAAKEYERHALGWRAAHRWFLGPFDGSEGLPEIGEYERVSQALVAGISLPMRRLESIIFWQLEPRDRD
jgi:hypothetical protein